MQYYCSILLSAKLKCLDLFVIIREALVSNYGETKKILRHSSIKLYALPIRNYTSSPTAYREVSMVLVSLTLL